MNLNNSLHSHFISKASFILCNLRTPTVWPPSSPTVVVFDQLANGIPSPSCPQDLSTNLLRITSICCLTAFKASTRRWGSKNTSLGLSAPSLRLHPRLLTYKSDHPFDNHRLPTYLCQSTNYQRPRCCIGSCTMVVLGRATVQGLSSPGEQRPISSYSFEDNSELQCIYPRHELSKSSHFHTAR